MSQDVRETRQNGMDDSTGRMTHYLPKYVSQNVVVHRKNDTLSAKVCVTECGGTPKE